MADKIVRLISKEPGRPPILHEVVDDDWDGDGQAVYRLLTTVITGMLTTYPDAEFHNGRRTGMTVYADDEGLLTPLPYNFQNPHHTAAGIHGPVVWTRIGPNGEDAGLTRDDIRSVFSRFCTPVPPLQGELL